MINEEAFLFANHIRSGNQNWNPRIIDIEYNEQT